LSTLVASLARMAASIKYNPRADSDKYPAQASTTITQLRVASPLPQLLNRAKLEISPPRHFKFPNNLLRTDSGSKPIHLTPFCNSINSQRRQIGKTRTSRWAESTFTLRKPYLGKMQASPPRSSFNLASWSTLIGLIMC